MIKIESPRDDILLRFWKSERVNKMKIPIIITIIKILIVHTYRYKSNAYTIT